MEYKDLVKMNLPDLREEAKKAGAKGTTGMKKDQLIELLVEAMDIKVPEKKPAKTKSKVLGKDDIKKKIDELRAARDKARADKNKKQVTMLQRRIHGFKRRLRKAA